MPQLKHYSHPSRGANILLTQTKALSILRPAYSVLIRLTIRPRFLDIRSDSHRNKEVVSLTSTAGCLENFQPT